MSLPSNYPTITQAQFLQRLLALLPTTWWSTAALNPGGVTYVILVGLAASLYYHKNGQLDYTLLQTRILTATGLNLENISYDFFGTTLPRIAGESDASYAERIIAQISAPKATIAAITAAANFYLSNIYVIPYETIYPLMGLNIIGGLNTRGGLNGPGGITQDLPSVVIWDEISDPTDAATYDIHAPYFVVDIDFPIRVGTGWVLKYTPITYGSALFDTTTLNPIPAADVDPGLVATIQETKAAGAIPVYYYHRSIGELS